MITEDYVNFETAKLLKEKGFDEDITTYRDDFIQHGNIVIPLQECISKDKIKTPTLQMAMKWLREVHSLFIRITEDMTGNVFEWSVYQKNYGCRASTHVESSYEQACEEAIKYCLKILF